MTTKIPVELSSTPGIVDGSNATAITIDSSENVGVGTTSPNTLLHAATGSNGSGLIDVARFQNTGTSVNDGARIQLTAGTSTSGAGIGCLGDALNSAHLVLHAGGNTEQMRINSNGNVRVQNGNLEIGTSGKGIDFGSTSDGSGTSSSEVFDDYEEGTWSPTFAGVATSASYGATYIKIGRQVIAECYIAGNTQNNTNQFQLGGLPYTSANETTYGGGSLSYVGSVDLSEFADPIVVPNGNYAYFHYIDGSQSGNNVTNNVLYNKEAGNILFLAQFIYRAAS